MDGNKVRAVQSLDLNEVKPPMVTDVLGSMLNVADVQQEILARVTTSQHLPQVYRPNR